MEGNESSPIEETSQKESGKLDSKEQEEGRPAGELDTGGPVPGTQLWGPRQQDP